MRSEQKEQVPPARFRSGLPRETVTSNNTRETSHVLLFAFQKFRKFLTPRSTARLYVLSLDRSIDDLKIPILAGLRSVNSTSIFSFLALLFSGSLLLPSFALPYFWTVLVDNNWESRRDPDLSLNRVRLALARGRFSKAWLNQNAFYPLCSISICLCNVTKKRRFRNKREERSNR